MNWFARWSPVLLLVLAGCGDDSSGPGTSGLTPTPTDVGVPTGSPVTVSIGPAGGTLTSTDGILTVSIPAGALDTNVPISIQPITNEMPSGLGGAYRLGPGGTPFFLPVGLVFDYTDADVAGSSPEFLEVAVQDSGGYWTAVPDPVVLPAARTLSVNVTHFSDFSRVLGVQIRPAEATVRTGTSQALEVRFCRSVEVDGMTGLVYVCSGDGTDEDLAPLVSLRNWSVNGIVGGNAAVGTVQASASLFSASYVAPADRPDPSTVAASVEAKAGSGYELLVANLEILQDETWTGTASGVVPGEGTISVQVTWTVAEWIGSTAILRPSSGSAHFEPEDGTCVVTFAPDHALTADDGEMEIDYSVSPPAYTGAAGSLWMGTYFLVCPDPADNTSFTSQGGGNWFGGTGELAASGTKIAGTANLGGVTVTWDFTKE